MFAKQSKKDEIGFFNMQDAIFWGIQNLFKGRIVILLDDIPVKMMLSFWCGGNVLMDVRISEQIIELHISAYMKLMEL